jgi:uncharacterized damage-inducible protein DinB
VTYYGAQQLADSFRTVRKNTLAIAEEIPEDKYAFRATSEVMSVGEMLAHLAIAPMWQIDLHTRRVARLEFAMFAAHLQQLQVEQAALRTKADIVRTLKDNGDRMARSLKDSTKPRSPASSLSHPRCSPSRRRASRCSSASRNTRCTTAVS